MIGRMIQEIESYLASPMRDAGDSWEIEERRFLRGLLDQLQMQFAVMSVDR
jgi:hypothetical protein